MIEFMAARYGKFPWELKDIPIGMLFEWYDVAIKNASDEQALGLAEVAKIMKV